MSARGDGKPHSLRAFLVGFVIGSFVAAAVWIASNIATASALPSGVYRWMQGMATTLFPLAIFTLNPNGSPVLLASLLALNGCAFGLACVFASRVSRSGGHVVAFTLALLLLALIFNNAWVLVAFGTATQKGIAEAIHAFALVDWLSFVTISACIVLGMYALHRSGSRDHRR